MIAVTAFSSPDTRFLPNLVQMIVILMVVVLGGEGGGGQYLVPLRVVSIVFISFSFF